MAPQTIHTWTVRGTGLIPFDMLRYDQCWPYSETDSHRMEQTTRRPHHRTDTVTINLSSLTDTPTIGRWASFGWEVL